MVEGQQLTLKVHSGTTASGSEEKVWYSIRLMYSLGLVNPALRFGLFVHDRETKTRLTYPKIREITALLPGLRAVTADQVYR